MTPAAQETTADLRFPSWGGEDLNLRPTDYEFDQERLSDQPKCTNIAADQHEWVLKAAQRFATFRGPSRDKCGTPPLQRIT
jgi:hypothetical protein